MKKLTLTAALILGTAAPVLANAQLEAAVGAEPGQYTLSELAQMKFAQSEDSTNDARVFIDDVVVSFSTSAIHDADALAIFDRLAAESAENE
mgnify:CR=1 FL=1